MEIEEPNDGEEHVKGAIASGTMSEKSKLYWDFWERFRARVVSEHPDGQSEIHRRATIGMT